MANPTQKEHGFLQRLWALGCSLKLAIALASVATLLIMGGSLIMHFNPSIFGDIDQEIMGDWLPGALKKAPLLVAWVPLSGICILLFAINTLCCFIDWLLRIRFRWKKTGEYLIHLGFIFLTIAYLAFSINGFRSGQHRFFEGETRPVPHMEGYSLHLEKFTPKLEASGRPLDMINDLTLLKNGKKVAEASVKMNHPLIYDGLIILPSSFGRELRGFRFHMPALGFINLTEGSEMPVSDDLTIKIHELFANARQGPNGEALSAGNRLINPAMQLSLHNNGGQIWKGWFFLRNRQPDGLSKAGIFLRPTDPIFKTFSLLTINRDPGDKLALAGAFFISCGVVFAFFSFYRKRARGDRPEV